MDAPYSLMVNGVISKTGATSKSVKENSSAEFVGKHWFLLPSTMTTFALSKMLTKETHICKEEKHIAYRLIYELLADTSTSRVKKKRKRSGDETNLEAVASVMEQLDEFDKRHIKLDYMTSKRACEQLQNRGVIGCYQVDSYNREETVGCSIVWHNGELWGGTLNTQCLEVFVSIEIRKNLTLAGPEIHKELLAKELA